MKFMLGDKAMRLMSLPHPFGFQTIPNRPRPQRLDHVKVRSVSFAEEDGGPVVKRAPVFTSTQLRCER